MFDYPVHDKRRLKFSSPEGLKKVLQRFPLNKEFIDWVVEQGFKIEYRSDWREGRGAVWWGLKRIVVSSQGETDLMNKTLVHELIHISVPGIPSPWDAWISQIPYEEMIDQIAEIYLNDLEFMEYLKEKIPIFTEF